MIPGQLATGIDSQALHQRALEALRQRQDFQRSQASAHGEVLPTYAMERPDPNLGMMNDVEQGLSEAAGPGKRLGIRGLQGERVGSTNPTEAQWQTNPYNPQGPSFAQAAMNALMKQRYPGAGV